MNGNVPLAFHFHVPFPHKFPNSILRFCHLLTFLCVSAVIHDWLAFSPLLQPNWPSTSPTSILSIPTKCVCVVGSIPSSPLSNFQTHFFTFSTFTIFPSLSLTSFFFPVSGRPFSPPIHFVLFPSPISIKSFSSTADEKPSIWPFHGSGGGVLLIERTHSPPRSHSHSHLFMVHLLPPCFSLCFFLFCLLVPANHQICLLSKRLD